MLLSLPVSFRRKNGLRESDLPESRLELPDITTQDYMTALFISRFDLRFLLDD